MDYYRVTVNQDYNDHCVNFDGDELDAALLYFLQNCNADAKTTLTYVGEEHDEE